MVFSDEGILASTNLVQFQNALLLMTSTVEGRLMLSSLSQKTKAPNGIIVMPSFKTAVFKDSHRWNTNEDNVVFPETVIDSMPVFWNA